MEKLDFLRDGPPWNPGVLLTSHLAPNVQTRQLISLSTQDLRNGNMLRYAESPRVAYEKASPIKEADLVSINVCGMVYETLQSTLQKFPNTLLGDEKRREKHFVNSRNMYFFDRNRQSFEAILYYYQTGGILIRPPNVPMVLFSEEISFFDLGEVAFMKLQEEEGYIPDKERLLPKKEWQRKIWELFEFPDTSTAARILAGWSIFVIVLSITVFCVETLPEFSKEDSENTTSTENNSRNKFTQPWFSLELGCIVWFTFEYIMRLISSPQKWKFLKSFLNVIDLLAIAPYFITLSLSNGDTTPLSVLRVVRLVRVFRIFKLSRHSLGLRILGHTLKASVSELGMLIFFLILGVILFSSAIFYAEQGQNDEFQSIPDTFWYCLVTMTTVGYGDKVPATLIGKLVGSLCAIVGVLMIALPVPVIVSNFEFFYKRDRMSYDNRTITGEPFRPASGTPEKSSEPLLKCETGM
ncbi:potassium voltage-gated channel subfamily A member 1-like isoform X2 [Hydractinia symbiolongicarpus]|uniref:potassium voltage-gated channel subfamily A member 1-like isoform X2 n=1 Tax=Hydractinia symbiolongicarpus TaxID=13093 RepID=UPI00254A222B|nr:potassium voltage-gated channel subfamily A member 1-like isoform X2 [Hydractinia symbiolongicarpus]